MGLKNLLCPNVITHKWGGGIESPAEVRNRVAVSPQKDKNNTTLCIVLMTQVCALFHLE